MDREELIRKEIEKLKGAAESRLMRYNDELSRKRTAWFESRRISMESSSAEAASRDTLETAYRLLLEKFGAAPEEMPVVKREKNRIVFHSMNFCPTLEACIILGLDTRRVCRLYNEKATNALIELVDPALRFTRNYERLRPYSAFCEEMIIRKNHDY